MPAFDPEVHELDPHTGFQRHKLGGHLAGIEHVPPHASKHEDPNWPKWVKPHESHIVRQSRGPGHSHISTPHFTQHHVDRESGEVTVLVHTPEQEAHALKERKAVPDRVPSHPHGGVEAGETPALVHDHEARAIATSGSSPMYSDDDVNRLAGLVRDKADARFSQHVDPETRHLHDAAVKVAGVLGMEADALNVGHLMGLLEPHAKPASYPKMKYHHERKAHCTVASKEEEHALGPDWRDDHWIES